MDNSDVARILQEIADLLELQGVKFKPQAYRKAARSIESLEEDIMTFKDYTVIPGVGEAIAKKIDEIVRTGRLEYLEKLKEETPEEVGELLNLPEIGPKTAQILASQGITSISALEKALERHLLPRMKGFGPKTEENLKRSIELYQFKKERRLLGKVLPVCRKLEEALLHVCDNVVVAGSVRRWKDTVGDIDILAISRRPEQVMNTFTALAEVKHVISKGPTRSTVILRNGIQSDVRVLPEESFGSALQYFTGSKEHNISLRNLALRKGLKLSEYGLFNRKTGEKVGGDSEEGIYQTLGLEYIPPELRENSGEIEAAQTNSLPQLVELTDIKGDLHLHTDWSDGSDSLEAMILKARALAYEYVGIADHSQSLRIAGGLSPEKLLEQHAIIKKLDDTIDGITILSGVESDILPDGSLDYPESILEQLDFVIASVHSGFKAPQDVITRRVVKAMRNPLVTILGHPTGRIIGRRGALDLDMNVIFEVAEETKTALEINCYPHRLDLNDIHVRKAGEYDITLALGTDAHSSQDLEFMELGVGTARRGWASRGMIMNTQCYRRR
ncbi:MAG: DNA polymerase/3'-5' exonuclease PolX [Theionarchaea archaeon]|nr:DNA polymerase/3'-5' exonuclease PolX [Theionarchaea archaeon]MBU6999501.1 DNA polymerase/3'-5' exonuclease PolX [Theionarchaea archaeon]MBU7021087.1 DNA polymerase/3'-5' exonuclease PolX [Theionarchaea archaeon]MBU7035617.1 DNA polymerase/3'-5' exonuclease PolX [Theionarchaea archaeon]MBU7040523.1 DNA polymerase/3'-5' exonuclease PolX [Theionarchaea archaeon]